MNPLHITLANKADLKQILQLQQQNFRSSISADEASAQGFVTLSHTLEDLELMNQPHPHIVVKDGDRVVAFALFMMPEHNDRFPALTPLLQASLPQTYKGKTIKDYRYFIMGQVCVDKDYRGHKLVDAMYQRMRSEAKDHFDLILTFIAKANTRSIRVHERCGWVSLPTSGDHDWIAVVLEV